MNNAHSAPGAATSSSDAAAAGADRVFRGRRIITPGGERACCVVVRNGSIMAITGYDEPAADVDCIEVGNAALLPGVVDTHVHLNDPGRADWEGFASGTRAAAAGGITTLVDMPLNSVPATTTSAALKAKRAAADRQCHVDVGFWGGVVPGNGADIAALWDAGVLGFKCFLSPSGVAEFGHVDATDLVHVLPLLVERAAPLLVHAELPAMLDAATAHVAASAHDAASAHAQRDPRSYAAYVASRPDAAEVGAVRLLIELCRETRARIHVVHVSSAEVLPLLRAAHAEGLPITAETCPHYLHFAAESIGDGRTEWKCAPPIRSAANRDALWRALAAGDLDLIASDHSPAPPELKCTDSGSFTAAWGGIASLQLALPIVWSGARMRGFSLTQLAGWMSAAPARLAGLPRKGAIEVGGDADFVVLDTEAEWTVDAASLHHRHPLTPYAGERLTGRVRATYLRGERIFDENDGHTAAHGTLIDRASYGGQWTSLS
jgi:allantoinase